MQVMLLSDNRYSPLIENKLESPNVSWIAAFPVANLKSPRSIAIDPFNRKMYWIDDDGKLVQRANLDGTGTET
ncbi:MAG: hypothetical protein HC784_10505, partial [Hydrococcus sp. CSU_1_8]|nr:hypothetical protein [Hydrococcus sp. CSU_1_8]